MDAAAGRSQGAGARPVPVPERVPVVLNVMAGRGAVRERAGIVDTFRSVGVAVELTETSAEGVAGRVRELADAGASLIAVAGGDGSLSAAAGELVGRRAVLLPVPIGTLNHFARRLGIDGVEGAAAALAAGGVAGVSVGLVNGRVFLNSVSCGFYAEVVRKRERVRRWIGRWPAQALAFLRVVVRLPRLEVRLRAGRRSVVAVTPLVWVGMGRGSVPLSHTAERGADARELEVVVLGRWGRVALLRLLGTAVGRLLRAGRPAPGRGLEVFHARRVDLDARGRVDITVDGEPGCMESPVRLCVRDGGLSVVVPRADA